MIATITIIAMSFNSQVAVLPKELEVPRFVRFKASKRKNEPYYAKYFR